MEKETMEQLQQLANNKSYCCVEIDVQNGWGPCSAIWKDKQYWCFYCRVVDVVSDYNEKIKTDKSLGSDN